MSDLTGAAPLTIASLARCADCGRDVAGAHACVAVVDIPESDFERHVRFVARGRLIRRMAREGGAT